ncbi:helix-turn-helix domain-containing protein [Marinovum algicola]|uniref:helix-turn-helix domain-containing protein n=1 Tax=Marinovum algicola TaxID=42444 RepID=UPI003B51C6E4
MTPDEFKKRREELDLTQAQLARILGLGRDGPRTVRRWEAPPGTNGARPPNPVAAQVLIWMGQAGRPTDWPVT